MVRVWNDRERKYEDLLAGRYDCEGFVVVGFLHGNIYLRANTEMPPCTENHESTKAAEHKFHCLSNSAAGLQNPGGWKGEQYVRS